MQPSQYFRSLSLLLLLGTIHLSGATFPDKPSSKHYYVDEADLIAVDTGKEIDGVAAALLKEEKIPLFVVTIPSLSYHEALTIERYATALFDHWGIGSQERNFGILLLISLGDRKARIELGTGWGNDYDYQAQRIMDTLIVPQFKRGDYAGGIIEGVKGLDAMARGLGLPKPKVPWWHLPAFLLLVLLIVGIIINLFRTGRSGWAWALIIGLGALLVFMARNSSSGSGGGFGGGSSGGGGASGSW